MPARNLAKIMLRDLGVYFFIGKSGS